MWKLIFHFALSLHFLSSHICLEKKFKQNTKIQIIYNFIRYKMLFTFPKNIIYQYRAVTIRFSFNESIVFQMNSWHTAVSFLSMSRPFKFRITLSTSGGVVLKASVVMHILRPTLWQSLYLLSYELLLSFLPPNNWSMSLNWSYNCHILVLYWIKS